MAITRDNTHSSLKSWMLGGIAVVLIIGCIGSYGFLHLELGILLANLWKPYGIISGIVLLTFPAMHARLLHPQENR